MEEKQNLNSGIYTPDEEELILYTRQIRKKAIDQLTKDGMPHKTNELRIINELANSLDAQVKETAVLRVKHKEENSREAMVELVASILGKIDERPMPANREMTLPEDQLEIELVPGEMDINPKELSLNEFIEDEKEKN